MLGIWWGSFVQWVIIRLTEDQKPENSPYNFAVANGTRWRHGRRFGNPITYIKQVENGLAMAILQYVLENADGHNRGPSDWQADILPTV